MLLQVGRRTASEDVADLLAECHGRIRRFLGMARALADAPAQARPAEIVDAAAQVRRYFAEGLPLHVDDEEIDIAPHLSDAVAAQIRAEHDTHERALAALITTCRELESRPERISVLAGDLRATVVDLTALLEAHLAFEERVAFPEIRRFDRARQQVIKDAMRSRRERHLS